MLIYVEAELLGDCQMVNLNTARRIYIGETKELKMGDLERYSHYGEHCVAIEMNDGRLCIYKHGSRKECDKSMKKIEKENISLSNPHRFSNTWYIYTLYNAINPYIYWAFP